MLKFIVSGFVSRKKFIRSSCPFTQEYFKVRYLYHFLRLTELIVKETLLQKSYIVVLFVIGECFFPSFQLENESFVLKGLNNFISKL